MSFCNFCNSPKLSDLQLNISFLNYLCKRKQQKTGIMYIKKSVAAVSVIAVAAVSYLMGAFIGLSFIDKDSASGDISKTNNVLKESVVTSKVPKKLDTFVPFWGVPQPISGAAEGVQTMDDIYFHRDSETAFPNWICWNLDLATESSQRYKFEKFLADGQKLSCSEMLRATIDECYRWAWRKPYGNTNVVMGPLYNKNNGADPYAYFVAVCKKETLNVPMPLGYSSMAYLIPNNAPVKNVYEYSLSVHAVEHHSGYNLFSKLPKKVQAQVEEMTAYELLCSFQELDENNIQMLKPEMEKPDMGDDPRYDNDRSIN